MRTFELSTRITAISRGDGRSATAAAAYRACCVVECEREGRTHDYTRKRGLEATEIVLPKGSPDWASDRQQLWNAAEMRERNGVRGKNARAFKADAKTAREFMFTYPSDLSADGRLNVARTIAQHLVSTHGIAADFAIHEPSMLGDQRNFHCHMLTTTRRITSEGLMKKAREWDDLKTGAALSKAFRRLLAEIMNAALADEGKGKLVHVEHRSFKARGSARIPTRHQGVQRTNAKRQERKIARAAWERDNRDLQSDWHEKERAALTVRQAFALASKLGHLADRERLGIETIRTQLAREQANDRSPTGASRLFQIATGQAVQADAARATRLNERVAAADRDIAALKTSVETERRAYAAGQANERLALAEKHRGQNVQFRQAVIAREAFDRAAEVHARREQVRDRALEHLLAQGLDRTGPR